MRFLVAGGPAELPNPRLRVRIYNLAGIDPKVLAQAERVATDVFDRAQITTEWKERPATEPGPEPGMTAATAGYQGQGAVSPPAGPPPAMPPAPERMFCEHGLTYAYCFSRHSYSAIWRPWK